MIFSISFRCEFVMAIVKERLVKEESKQFNHLHLVRALIAYISGRVRLKSSASGALLDACSLTLTSKTIDGGSTPYCFTLRLLMDANKCRLSTIL